MLISFGAFWFSLWTVALLGWPFDKLNNGIVCGDGVLSTLAMGVMTSMGRTLAAVLAALLVTVIISGRKSELWALIVAVLYLVDPPLRFSHWSLPPTASDRLWQAVNFISPAVACTAAVLVIWRLRKNRSNPGHVAEPNASG